MLDTFRDFRGPIRRLKTLDELNENLREVIQLLLREGEPRMEGEFIGIQTVAVA